MGVKMKLKIEGCWTPDFEIGFMFWPNGKDLLLSLGYFLIEIKI